MCFVYDVGLLFVSVVVVFCCCFVIPLLFCDFVAVL